jgi:hypothetical protein
VREAVRLNPDHAEAHKSRAMTWLQLGDFERGWQEFEWRWRCKDFDPRPYDQPAWDSGALEGRSLLLYTEQGIDDNIQFIRCPSLLAEKRAQVIVDCAGSGWALPRSSSNLATVLCFRR